MKIFNINNLAECLACEVYNGKNKERFVAVAYR